MFTPGEKNLEIMGPGSLKDGVLTMKRVTADTVYFSDRPERITGRVTTQKFVAMTGYIFFNFVLHTL